MKAPEHNDVCPREFTTVLLLVAKKKMNQLEITSVKVYHRIMYTVILFFVEKKKDTGFTKHMYNVYTYNLFYSFNKDILSSQYVLQCVLDATLVCTCSSREED